MVNYIEIIEDVEDSFEKVPQMIRINVADEAEGETKYAEEIKKFDGMKTRQQFVKVNHNKDPKLNKPCEAKEIKDGKIITV